MKGSVRLKRWLGDLRKVTPAEAEAKVDENLTLIFEQYGVEIRRRRQMGHYADWVVDNSDLTEMQLRVVHDRVQEIIRNHRYAYMDIVPLLFPEASLKILDGWKAEDTLVNGVGSMLNSMARRLPTAVGATKMEFEYTAEDFIVTLKMNEEAKSKSPIKYTWGAIWAARIYEAYYIVQNLRNLLLWYTGVDEILQAMAKTHRRVSTSVALITGSFGG